MHFYIVTLTVYIILCFAFALNIITCYFKTVFLFLSLKMLKVFKWVIHDHNTKFKRYKKKYVDKYNS